MFPKEKITTTTITEGEEQQGRQKPKGTTTKTIPKKTNNNRFGEDKEKRNEKKKVTRRTMFSDQIELLCIVWAHNLCCKKGQMAKTFSWRALQRYLFILTRSAELAITSKLTIVMITFWHRRLFGVTLIISVNVCHLNRYDSYKNCPLDCPRVQVALQCIKL